MAIKGKLVKRHQKVAYYGVPASTGNTVTFTRMKGFTSMSTSKNSKEYSRQYVDEAFEESDVTGYSPSMSYAFDQYKGNAVHDDIVNITDNELTGNDAVREIVLVDLTDEKTEGSYGARKRSFAVIPDSEGDSTDAYTYSGTFKTKGESITGTATIDGDAQTLTFTADTTD